jgi:preprotein translocase subunit YajC
VKELAPLLWIIAIALIFWLLIIRPAQRRQKEVAQVQSSLVPGAEVMLSSGIFGTVTQIDDASLLVEIAPGVNVKVARGAISSVVRPDEAAADDANDTDTSGSGDVDDEER